MTKEAASTSTAGGPPAGGHAQGPARQVVLLYKRHATPDASLLTFLEQQLSRLGFGVFIDRHLTLGVDWAREIERRIGAADAVIPLLSESSIQSEMLGFEIEIAHEAAQNQRGRPALLPVRVNFGGPLPEPLAGILDPIQYVLWHGEADHPRVLAEILKALDQIPAAPAGAPKAIGKGARLLPRPVALPRLAAPAPADNGEAVRGAVALGSKYYINRPVDEELQHAVARQDSTILIKGARQMGKTSLLARGLQVARDHHFKVALTDFQKFDASNLESPKALYLSLAESIVEQLDLPVLPSDAWDDRRGPNLNFERFIRREILAKLEGPLAWGLDEVDRLFAYPYGSEVFGLFRAWHNERALDPAGPWGRLTLLIAYATEAHLFISDINQSPFNVGTRLTLDDFTAQQVGELNERYGSPLQDRAELTRFIRLAGGQPYLVRRGLRELARQSVTLDTLAQTAAQDDGIYGDHLRRLLVLLVKDPQLTEVMCDLLKGAPCPNADSFYRLRSAGIVSGGSHHDAAPRCQLYAQYLGRHLLG